MINSIKSGAKGSPDQSKCSISQIIVKIFKLCSICYLFNFSAHEMIQISEQNDKNAEKVKKLLFLFFCSTYYF